MLKKCSRCRKVYEKPAQKPQANGMTLLACPSCGCYSYTRMKSAEQNMHSDAAFAAVKPADTAPEQSPVKAAGSQAAPVM